MNHIIQNNYSPTNSLFAFDRSKVAHLSARDQFLFEQYGQGEVKTLPYSRLHHAFEARATETPSAVAACYGDDKISYHDLNQQAERLANRLRGLGVVSGDAVGLFMRRSIDMLVGMLAILKLGAAYVPQDIKIAPTRQLQLVVAQAKLKVVLTTSAYIDLCPVLPELTTIAVDEVVAEDRASGLDQTVSLVPKPDISPDQTCFILFTSGTTGNPNGVRVTHRNVCNIVLTNPGNLGVQSGMKVGQLLNIAFDMSAWEVWICLSFGGTLMIRGRNMQETAEQCDVLVATPSILSSLDSSLCRQVKTVAVAGEPCPRPLADEWSEFCRFYNSCGPTETTIINTAILHTPTKAALTIGVPTPNNTVYILDEHGRAAAMGEVGEMWAGGDCVTNGYINNDELNQTRYRDDPFLGGGQKMFCTRDLGRWNQDGELEHHGRTDDQVKIRGFRVELDSVSRVLESVEQCRQAVTLKLDNQNLVSFVTPLTVDAAAASAAAKARLPYYCEPRLNLTLEDFPKTSRGKLDKRLLLDLAREKLSNTSKRTAAMEV